MCEREVVDGAFHFHTALKIKLLTFLFLSRTFGRKASPDGDPSLAAAIGIGAANLRLKGGG